ncbi:MAG: hypothetical protein IPK22_26120 [Verrucomicrobiaceae bacterium]|nr:hypothetical protein [Verrucomicrobiaceae bacterium]
MIATVFRVVTAKLWESTQINPDYVDAVYEDVQGRGWSGDTRENKPLITGEGDIKPSEDKPTLRDVTKKADSTVAEKSQRRQHPKFLLPPPPLSPPCRTSMASPTSRRSALRSRPSFVAFSKPTAST